MNIFAYKIDNTHRHIYKVQLDCLVMLEMIQSRVLERPFARLPRWWHIVLSLIIMETHCQFDTSWSKIYMWISYRCTHMVNNCILSRRKDTTARD